MNPMCRMQTEGNKNLKAITKKSIRIVATGDSMTQGAGAGCPALAAELACDYPGKDFEIINQGVGGTRAGYGLWRLTNEYEYEGKKHPALVTLQPDIVILESFAYNNATDGLGEREIQHFRDMHHKMVNEIKTQTQARIIFVVTIAPDLDHFLETVPSFVHTPKDILRWMAEDRIQYIKEAIKIAEELNLPLVNVYAATQAAKAEGTPLSTFIDPTDSIHPSSRGHELTATLIAATLKNCRMITQTSKVKQTA
jgi:lysophospholipase L1-like esterase